MSNLLGTIFGRADAMKRGLFDLAQNPVASMQQTAGLLSENRNKMMGLLDQAVDKDFRVKDQQALGQVSNNMLTGLLGFAPVGMAQLVKPLGTGPHYATDNLAEYTPQLYRETSIDRATEFLPNSMSNPQTLWFSNEPAYALGQGANRGVMMEFNAKGIPGQLSLQKPMARQQYEAGNAEFVAQDLRPEQIGGNLQSIRIDRSQQTGPYFRRVQGLLKDWNVAREADGTLVFTRK